MDLDIVNMGIKFNVDEHESIAIMDDLCNKILRIVKDDFENSNVLIRQLLNMNGYVVNTIKYFNRLNSFVLFVYKVVGYYMDSFWFDGYDVNRIINNLIEKTRLILEKGGYL